MVRTSLNSTSARTEHASPGCHMKLIYLIRSHKCPICGSRDIHRSRRRGIAEQLACRLTPIRPFRCNACDARIYAYEQQDAKKSA